MVKFVAVLFVAIFIGAVHSHTHNIPLGSPQAGDVANNSRQPHQPLPVCATDGSNTYIFQNRHQYRQAARASNNAMYMIPLHTCQPNDPMFNMMDQEKFAEVKEVQAKINAWPRAFTPWQH